MGILRRELIKIISLSYPRYRIATFLFVLFLLLILPIKVVAFTNKLSLCSILLKRFCFSEGITRGVSSLLKGNFHQAVSYNPLSILVFIVIFGIIIFDFIKILKIKK